MFNVYFMRLKLKILNKDENYINEMFGWHYRLDRHEFEQAPGVDDGQGSLACCISWGHKESDMTELN